MRKLIFIAGLLLAFAAGADVKQYNNGAATGAPPTGAASNDLGGTYPGPLVLSTHLSAPLPIAQGGTGSTGGALLPGNNLSDVSSASTSRTNLGVPTGTSGHVLGFLDAANVISSIWTFNAGIALAGAATITTTGIAANFLTTNTDLSPSGVNPTTKITSVGKGDNTTFIGVSNGYFQAADDASVIAGTKGVLYGLQLSIRPLVTRNNVPFDDATGLVVQNDAPGVFKSTDAVYIGHNSLFTTGAAEWVNSFLTDANSTYAFHATGTYTYGLDLSLSTLNGGGVRGPNNKPLSLALDSTGLVDVEVARVDSSNRVSFNNGALVIPNSSGSAVISRSLNPGSDNSLTLGTTGTRYSNIYGLALQGDNGTHGWGVTYGASGSGDTSFIIGHDGATRLQISPSGGTAGAWQIGAPTGGFQGVNSVNVQGGIYNNGTLMANPRTFTATYDPASLAAATQRADSVTVTGITTTGGAVIANPGTTPAAFCVIASVRASSTNTVEVTWQNTAAAATACDTASSTWTFTQAQ